MTSEKKQGEMDKERGWCGEEVTTEGRYGAPGQRRQADATTGKRGGETKERTKAAAKKRQEAECPTQGLLSRLAHNEASLCVLPHLMTTFLCVCKNGV